jgi:hypothetical protein
MLVGTSSGWRIGALLGRLLRLEAEKTTLRSTAETISTPELTQWEADVRTLKDSTLQSDVALLKGRMDSLQILQQSAAVGQSDVIAALGPLQSDMKTLKEHPGRCDGDANTLTVILDADGNIFGGFSPLEWDSTSGWKQDGSMNSFLFTLKNPHNVPAPRFTLKSKTYRIQSHSTCGPQFYDMNFRDYCNAIAENDTSGFGNGYTNVTGLGGQTFFTGSKNFTVKEIEVFKITA